MMFFVLIIPIAQFSFTKEGSERFAQTSAFSEYPAHSNLEKIAVYPLVYLKNYISFFSLNCLFNFGDGNGRHQIATFGLFYRWEFFFLLIGLYFLAKQKKSYLFAVLLGMLLLAVVPAALSRPSPHSLRPILMVVPLTIIVSLGFLGVLAWVKRYRLPFILLILLVVIYEFVYMAHFYSYHYPKINALDWGSGYKELVLATQELKDKYPMIVVDGRLSDSKAYFNFYGNDIHYEFIGDNWSKPETLKDKKILYIRPYYGSKRGEHIIKNVMLPNGRDDIFAQFWEI
jgi:hypothetical protein